MDDKDFEMPEIDLSSSVNGGQSNPDLLIQRASSEAKLGRWLRGILFVATLLGIVLFMTVSLLFALRVGFGILESKKILVEAAVHQNEMLINNQMQMDSYAQQHHLSNLAKARASEVAIQQAKEMYSPLLTYQNWMSAGALLLIIASLLGVGLTMLLNLMRAVFHGNNNAEQKNKTNNGESVLATPLSGIIEGIVDVIKNKFMK